MLVDKELISCPEGFLMGGGVHVWVWGGRSTPPPTSYPPHMPPSPTPVASRDLALQHLWLMNFGSLTPVEKGTRGSFDRELDFIFSIWSPETHN